MKPNQNGLVTQIPIKNKAGQVIGHKEVVTYRGLLSRAHDEHLVSIETAIIQFPKEDNGNTAVVSAKVTTSKGNFSAVGDASPGNVNPMIAPHIIRMAETRAKARAIRDAVNIGVVCLEELGAEIDGGAIYEGDFVAIETGAEGDTGSVPARTGNSGNQAMAEPAKSENSGAARKTPSESLTESQRRYLFRLLANKGIMGEAAKTWLCQRFKVQTLKDASKAVASTLIEDLLKGGNGEEASHAHPA